MYPMSTLNDAVTLAQEVEKQLQNQPRYPSYRVPPSPTSTSQNSGTLPSSNPTSTNYSDPKLFTPSTSQSNSQSFSLQTTHKDSHPTRTNFRQSNQYPLKQSTNPYLKPMPIICYRCNQLGHRSNECLKRFSTVGYVDDTTLLTNSFLTKKLN